MWSFAITSPYKATARGATARGARDATTPTAARRRPELDQAAFERLHARTSQALWGYLRRLTGDPAVADDVHQESYLRFLERFAGGGRAEAPDGGESRQSAYLFRIATNLVHDRWRRQKRERGWLDQLLAPESASRQATLSVDFDNVFGRLKPRQRALLWLAHVEGYSHREIAGILSLKERSVKVLLFRARGRLAELLRRHGLDRAPANLEEVKP